MAGGRLSGCGPPLVLVGGVECGGSAGCGLEVAVPAEVELAVDGVVAHAIWGVVRSSIVGLASRSMYGRCAMGHGGGGRR